MLAKKLRQFWMVAVVGVGLGIGGCQVNVDAEECHDDCDDTHGSCVVDCDDDNECVIACDADFDECDRDCDDD